MTEPRFSRLQQSLQQGYTLNLKAVFQEAWQRIYGAKMPLLLATIGVVGCWLILNQLLVNMAGDEQEISWQLNVLGLVISMVIAPMTGGLDMMGVYRSVDRPIRANQIFDYFRFLLPLAVASFLMGLISNVFIPLGQMLGLPAELAMLPVLILSVALMFTFPLMLEKGLSPIPAIISSLRLFSRQWITLLSIHIAMTLLFAVAVLTLGVGLIWLVPLYTVIKGILYREACGVEGINSQPTGENTPSSNVSKDNFEA